MKEIIIRKNEAGQRLDKFLRKYLKEAPGSFLYKMLRKKNITLNGKKASGGEKLAEGDAIRLFLSDETIQRFSSEERIEIAPENLSSDLTPDIIYEDRNIILLNKPVGMLSQKAQKTDVSVVEYVISYLLAQGEITEESLKTFKPSVCNRLDRNTSGLIIAGKSLAGSQTASSLLKERTLQKYYLCITKGQITQRERIRGFLTKDIKHNIVKISETGDAPIETEYLPLAWREDMTLLKVHLITGKTHQIRAHLAYAGHPLLGDYKYGDRAWNDDFKRRYRIETQMLHAYQIVFPHMDVPFAEISGKSFYAKAPAVFWKLIKETSWEHGIQEALEVQH